MLLSLNRYFYILRPTQAESSPGQGAHGQTFGYKIVSKIEREATQHFEVFEEQDLLVATDESNKFVNFYALSELVTQTPSNFPLAKHQQ